MKEKREREIQRVRSPDTHTHTYTPHTYHPTILPDLSHLHCPDAWLQPLVRVDVGPVEIFPPRVQPEVTSRYAVGVQSRHDVEDEHAPEALGARIVRAEEKLDRAVEGVAPRRFPWVHPRGEEDGPLAPEGVRAEVGGGRKEDGGSGGGG